MLFNFKGFMVSRFQVSRVSGFWLCFEFGLRFQLVSKNLCQPLFFAKNGESSAEAMLVVLSVLGMKLR